MHIHNDQIESESLSKIAVQAAQLLCSSEFVKLENLFGYAVALGRQPSAAIAADLASSLSALGASELDKVRKPLTKVSYFDDNEPGLFALIECMIPTNIEENVLLELVVTSDGNSKHVTLEQISASESTDAESSRQR